MLRSLLLGLVAAVGGGPASIVVPIEDQNGIVYVTVRCQGAPNTAVCAGRIGLPQLDETTTAFTIAPGASKKLQSFIPGPVHSRVAKLKALTAVLTQMVDGQEQTKTTSYRLVHSAQDGPTSDALQISAGPATRYQAVRDSRGDAHSGSPLPQVFDIVLATAKRQGDAAVLTVSSTTPITQHDGYGNPIAPCVEIPWASASQTPMFLFGNGQLAGYTQSYWPKLKTSIHGATISWTIPRSLLARKGFTKGFLWRATGGCDQQNLGDRAPNSGFKTFRWVMVG